MNKKGAIFHWIIFGVLIALAIFFLGTQQSLNVDQKAYWSLHFLKNNYVEAEKILLSYESIERDIAKNAIQELAQNGGLQKNELSACGTLQNINLWNNNNQWCVPNAKNNFSTLAAAQLNQKILSIAFNEISYTGKVFHAKAKKQPLHTLLLKQHNFPSDQTYFYDPSFAIELSYSLDEYTQLQSEAKLLVEKCHNTQEFTTCINNAKPTHWHSGFCEYKENTKNKPTGPSTQDRKIIFCIQSPNGYTLNTGQANIKDPLLYTFALDFTPSSLLPVQDTTITYLKDKEIYLFQFSPNPLAQGYKIYYTNWLIIKDNTPGNAQDIFSSVPKDPALGFYETTLISSANLQPCVAQADAQPNQAYLCQNKINYYLSNPQLKKDISYIAGITAHTGKEESFLTNFVDMSSK